MYRNHTALVWMLGGALLIGMSPVLASSDPFDTEQSVSAGPFVRDPDAPGCAKAGLNHPLALPDVIERALCNNPQTRAQWAIARAQAAQLGVSLSSYLPTLTAQASATHTRTSTGGVTGTGEQDSVGVVANYLLYDFGGRQANVEMARQMLVAANAARDEALQGIFSGAAQAYYALLSARASVAAYQVAEQAADRSMQAAEARYHAGTATLSDRLQAQTALSQAKLNRIRAEGDAAIAQGTLAHLMGYASNQAFVLVLPAQEEGAGLVPDPVMERHIGALIEEAQKNRPELLAAEAQIKSAEAQRAASRAAGLPSMTLNGAAGQSGTSGAADRVRSQSLGIALSVPLFSGYKNTYQSRAAQSQLEAKQAERDRLASQVALDVWKAYQAMLTNSQALQAANDLLASAEQSERMISGRYQAGLGNILDVLSAQSALASARQQQVSALYTFKAGKLEMAQAIGQFDWMGAEFSYRKEQ